MSDETEWDLMVAANVGADGTLCCTCVTDDGHCRADGAVAVWLPDDKWRGEAACPKHLPPSMRPTAPAVTSPVPPVWTVDEACDLIDSDGDTWMTVSDAWAGPLRSQLAAGALLQAAPEGCYVSVDGSLAAPGAVVRRLLEEDPQGWGWSAAGGRWVSHLPGHSGAYFLRRRSQPETVKVPWAESKDRTLHNNLVVESVRHMKGTKYPEIQAGGLWHLVRSSDGLVSVLPEDGEQR